MNGIPYGMHIGGSVWQSNDASTLASAFSSHSMTGLAGWIYTEGRGLHLASHNLSAG